MRDKGERIRIRIDAETKRRCESGLEVCKEWEKRTNNMSEGRTEKKEETWERKKDKGKAIMNNGNKDEDITSEEGMIDIRNKRKGKIKD